MTVRHSLLFLAFLPSLFSAESGFSFHQIEIDGRTVSYTIQDGFAITQGDVILGRADELETYRQGRARGRNAAVPQSVHVAVGASGIQLWPNATMYFTINGDTPVQQNLLDAIAYWNKVGPFQILPRDTQPNYVTFRSIVTDAACNSAIGMTGGQQFIGVTSGCSVGAAIHELGHAWGLLHEQVRPDRGAHVTILYENIDKRYYPDFNQTTSSVSSGYYDFDSIMHYGASGFARNFENTIETVPVGIPIGQRNGLSAGDIDGVNRLYGFIPTMTTVTTTPAGLPIVVDGAAATSPQAYLWAPGSQHTVSVPQTQGTVPRLAFAGWSDGGAAAHTITAGANVTAFCANFSRQYPVQTGVAGGAGTVSLFPASADAYLADRFPFQVTATPAPGWQFVRWTGVTFLGVSGDSVSATPARVEVESGAASYQAGFTSGPLTTVDAQPEGAAVLVDGLSYYTPVNFAWAPGSQHTLGYASPQLQGTSTLRFQFLNWDDGSTGTRTVTAASQAATYTARFEKQYLLSTGTLGLGTVSASPASADGFYDAGTRVQLTATPSGGQAVRYWVGDAAGGGTQQTVVMDQQRLASAYFASPLQWLALHAASFTVSPFFGSTGQSVAPGEILTFFGAGIGPASAVGTAPDGSGRLPLSASGVAVMFDRYPAPILYAAADQINVVVPYELAGQTATTVVITKNGVATNPFSLSVYATLPGLFTAGGTGQGAVAALNQDGTVNSAANAAAAGSVVVLYGTGGGLMSKTVADGQVAGPDLATAVAPVYARVGRLPAEVLYAGSAPGLVSGALQMNVRIPAETIGGGAVPIQVIVGEFTSAPGTTVWVK